MAWSPRCIRSSPRTAAPGSAGPAAPAPAPEPFELEGIHLHPVPLSADELERYYEGQSNATIWPLYHDAVEPPMFRRRWREAYRTVNPRFAEAAAQVAADGATVWVQDYQLQLVPAMLRERRPDLRIGFFLHIPFPPIELFMQMPQRAEILRGLLGADLVGFQQRLAAQNFVRLARHLLGLRYEGQTIEVDGRRVKAGAFPISIDVAEMERMAASPAVQARAKQIRAELGDPKTVILGVDRLDYTKGIELRLKAFRELLADGRLTVPEAVMVQVATPSRERVEHYQALRVKVEREVGRINGEFGRVGVPAVHYLHQSYSRSELGRAVLCGRRDDGDPAARRDEPGGQGVRRGARRQRRRAGAQRVRRRRHRAAPGVPVQPARPRRGQGRAAARRRRRARPRPGGGCAIMQRHLRTHDVGHWARSFLTELGVPETGRT